MSNVVYHDEIEDRLVFTKREATSDYWEEHWFKGDKIQHIHKIKNRFVVTTTSKYLTKGTRILEGGCGIGDKVYALNKAGFNAMGVDYAKRVIEKVKDIYPGINIQSADIRKLPFKPNYFDGYWSLGVIEHFYHGYDEVINEMNRVIKNGGYLFLTTPVINPLRRLKILTKSYKQWNNQNDTSLPFYQFAFRRNDVIKKFEDYEFALISTKGFDGLKGYKDSTKIFHAYLQKIYDGKNIIYKFLKRILNFLLTPISYHMMLFIFQKR